MGKVIKFTPSFAKGKKDTDTLKERTPEEVRRFILGIEDNDGEEDLHVSMTFLNLDDVRTAIIGDYAAVQPLIDVLPGKIQQRKHIYDSEQSDRGPGIILSVTQVVELLQMMLEDGWTDLNPDVHIMAEARCKALQDKMRELK